MVTVIDFEKKKNSKGEEFNALIVQGGVEMVVSKESGKVYATARKARVPSTFNEQTCKELIGTKFPGSIQKEACEEYEFTIPESGETIKLSHRHFYSPEPSTMEEQVFA